MKKVTQSDISKALGISQATVGLVVGNTNSPLKARLNPKTVQRILDKAKEMGYIPHKGAQMMRKGRSNLIVLLNFGGYSEITAKRVFHIGRSIHAEGYDFQTIDAYWWAGSADHMVTQVIGLQPEGIIVSGSIQNDFSEKHIEELQQRGIPVVSLGLRFPNVPRVRYDAHSSQYELTKQLIESGRERLVMLTQRPAFRPSWQTEERISGFKQAVLEHGGCVKDLEEGRGFAKRTAKQKLQAGILRVPPKKDQFSPFTQGMTAMSHILQWITAPDALICVNDAFAIGAMSICYRNKVSIPKSVAFTGFDNLSFSTQGPIPLTSIEQPTEETSNAVVKTVIALLGKRPREFMSNDEQAFPCKIIWRESSGTPTSFETLDDEVETPFAGR